MILAPLYDLHHPLPDVSVGDLRDGTEFRESTRMLLAMGRLGKPVYEGTVPGHVKARRRAANKAARRARRCSR